jgi:hypothetical protein
MRLVQYGGLGLLVFLLLGEGLSPCNRVSAADDPKPEVPPAPMKEVLDRYLQALAAKDLKAMTALVDVPWLDRDRQVVRDRTGLDNALERVVIQLAKDEGQRKVETFRYKKMRERFKEEAERKLLDETLGENGWLVMVEEEGYPLSLRILLIRVKGGKAAVVGRPLKQNQITPQNRIPEVVDRLFDNAGMFELYSLDPEPKIGEDGKVVEVKDGFHGWQVLGKTGVKTMAGRKRLVAALRLAAEDNFGMAANCFIPRHGLRLKGGGQTVDLVICFQCLQVAVFVDGKRQEGFLITGEPQKEFDAMLTAAGIRLPKPAKQ